MPFVFGVDLLTQRLLTPLFIVVIGLVSSATSAQSKPASGFATLAAKADSARDGERLDEAVSLYRRALALRPSWAEGWWSLATIQYDRNVYADAARAFLKVTALTPKNGTAYAMLGLCEFELGHELLALQHLQKGMDIGLQKDESLWNVALYHEGVLLQRKGSFQAAQDVLEQLCLRGVKSDEAANALGMTLLRLTSKTPPAAGTTDADIVLRIGRADCLAGQKKYDDARAAFETVVRENPEYPNIHYAYGLFLLGVYDVTGGVGQLKEEIANNPGHVLARLRLAASLYKQDSAAAIPYAEEAVKLSPRLGFAHYLLGLLLLDTNNYERALPELEIAQKSFPKEAKLYFALGSAYSRSGRKQEAAHARAMFEKLTKEGTGSNAAGEMGLRGTTEEGSDKKGTAPPQ